MNLKEMIQKFRDEWDKGDKADKSVLEGLVDQMEPIASRDYATIKRLEKKAEGKTVDDVSGLEDKIAELSAELEKTQRESQKALKKASDDLKVAQDTAGAKSQTLSRLVRDQALQSELLAVGIKNPVHLKAAQAMLRELVQVDEEKAEAYVLSKDAKTGAEMRKSISEFAKEWAAGDEGKAFVTVPPSSGGGSSNPGRGAAPGASSMSRAEFEALPPEQQMEASKNGVSLTD